MSNSDIDKAIANLEAQATEMLLMTAERVAQLAGSDIAADFADRVALHLSSYAMERRGLNIKRKAHR